MNAPVKKEKQLGILDATTRDKFGKGATRALRREGKTPAIIYTNDGTPMNIALSTRELSREYMRGRFRSRVIDITLDGKTMQALPKDLQFDPVSDAIEHLDLIKVEKDSILRVQVPVVFRGIEKCVGIKRGGVLNIVRHEVELLCSPTSIPEKIEINIQKTDIGESIHIEDINLPADVKPSIDRNFTIATIAGRRKDEETTTATTEEGAAAEEGASEGDDKAKEEAKK